MPSDSQENVARRTKFYNDPEVARYRSKHGAPKTKRSLIDLIIAGTGHATDSTVTQELIDCLGFVIFAVHPQQINIRDKANGKIIAVTPR